MSVHRREEQRTEQNGEPVGVTKPEPGRGAAVHDPSTKMNRKHSISGDEHSNDARIRYYRLFIIITGLQSQEGTMSAKILWRSPENTVKTDDSKCQSSSHPAC